MAVNRFSTPVESNYISQYVPIPFEQLYALGREYNKRVDDNYDLIGDLIRKWLEFRSPSEVDTQRFYELTLNPAKELVNKLAANPDLIKTQAGRSEIQSFINSRPYDELNSLYQSRDNLLKRQTINTELMLKGLYDQNWHNVDFTNYNTKDEGIFNDLSPLAYKSEIDIVKPFVDNLKSSFIGTNGLYDVRGVSRARTREQVDLNISAILNSPYSQKHIETLLKQGLTRKEAENEFMNRIYTAANEFSYQDLQINPMLLLREKERLSGSRLRLTDISLNVATPRLQLTKNALDGTKNAMLFQFSKNQNNTEDLKNLNAIKSQEKLLLEALSRYLNIKLLTPKDSTDLKQLTDEYLKLKYAEDDITKGMIRKDFVSKYGEDIDFDNYDKSKLDIKNFGEASRSLIESYSASVPANQLERLLKIQYGLPTEVNTSSGKREGFIIDSNETLLPLQLASGIIGIDDVTDIPGLSTKPGIWSALSTGALVGMGTGTTVAGSATLGIGAIPGAVVGSLAGAGTAVLANLFSEAGEDNIAEMWSDSRGFGDIVVIPTKEVISINTANGDTEYVKATAIIPKKRLSERGIDKSILNSRDKRMSNALDAISNDEDDTYEFEVYVPLPQSQGSAKEYDRESSNKWYGSSTSDSDRYYEDTQEYGRYGLK